MVAVTTPSNSSALPSVLMSDVVFIVFPSFCFCRGAIRAAVVFVLLFSELPIPGLHHPVRRFGAKTFRDDENIF
jgi:hypothetical protein